MGMYDGIAAAQSLGNQFDKQFVDKGPESPFVTAANAFDNTRELCDRILVLAERLCGSVPQAVSGSGAANTASTPPAFRALGERASEAAGNVQAAMMALNRIERELP